MAPKDKSTAGGKSAIDKELIRELAKLLDETGLTEIEIERAGLRVRVGRSGGVTHITSHGGYVSSSPLPSYLQTKTSAICIVVNSSRIAVNVRTPGPGSKSATPVSVPAV